MRNADFLAEAFVFLPIFVYVRVLFHDIADALHTKAVMPGVFLPGFEFWIILNNRRTNAVSQAYCKTTTRIFRISPFLTVLSTAKTSSTADLSYRGFYPGGPVSAFRQTDTTICNSYTLPFIKASASQPSPLYGSPFIS